MQSSAPGTATINASLAPWVPCAHCGTLALGTSATDGIAFCCEGCRAVYAAIHAAGLEAFYADQDTSAKRPQPRVTHKRWTELEDPALQAHEHADGTRTTTLYVEGVHCGACVWLLESLPRVSRGVLDARLEFGRSRLTLRWDPRQTSLADIAKRLDGFGYALHANPGTSAQGERASERSLLTRLGVAGAIAGNVMLMALGLYSGAGQGLESGYAAMFRWGSFFLSLPSVLYCAAVFYRGAWASIRARVPSMDVPIALGISVGFLSGAFNTFRGYGEIYFDTITVLIFLLLVGRWLTARQHRRAATAADFAQALAPATARVVEEGRRREVPANAVVPGAVVEVLAGERIPVDGRIESGQSAIDVRLLTGESGSSDARPGDRVYAGTENLSSTILIRTEKSGPATRVGQLLSAMAEAQRERAPIVRTADRIAGYFVFAVIGCAAFTLAIWWSVDPALAVDRAVALLVVTCPCALGMATPLAVSVALSRAARRGILLKSGEVLEALARPADVLFDKSGTLTTGRPELVELHGSSELGRYASVAERGCDHPLARAFQRAFPPPPGLSATASQRSTGAGVRATVENHEILVGSAALLASADVALAEDLKAHLIAHAARGLTPVVIARDGHDQALAAFGDALRPDAVESLSRLAKLGYPISVLSGDHPLVVERICEVLPIESARGGMSPEAKLEEVRRRVRARRPVIMVGDGMNDAAAMAAATVGFAVHGGAEASLLAAGGFATEPGVQPVLQAIVGARETLHVIYRGIAFSLAYNVVGVVLAMSGILSPLVAAIMMPLSSLTVVTSALRSNAFAARARKSEHSP